MRRFLPVVEYLKKGKKVNKTLATSGVREVDEGVLLRVYIPTCGSDRDED